MKLLESAMLTIACLALLGCNAAQPPVARETLVGSYVYKSEDPEGRAKDHTWDHLTLQADGGYDLVQGGPTKPKREETGAWTIRLSRASGREVLLEHEGYPIQVEGDRVKLLIDNDVGIWFEKVR